MISQLISAETVRRWCLQHPGSYPDHPFGPDTTVYRLRGSKKMFGLQWAQVPGAVRELYGEHWRDGLVVLNLKTEPPLAEQLRGSYWQVRPGYHMNKTHWNSVAMVADGALTEGMLQDLIEDSYDLVANG